MSMDSAFIGFFNVPVNPTTSRSWSCNVMCSNSPAPQGRRVFLQCAAALAVLPVLPQTVLADRTGKFSTQLTAKRRYLPRIANGLQLLREASPSNASWPSSMVPFIEGAPSLVSALRLFATSFFAEGNRIGAKERALSNYVDTFAEAVDALQVSSRDGDRAAAKNAYERAVKAANVYIETAKLLDKLEVISLQ